ncbi:aromatic peroxygenase [Pyrenophora seminiperda CCB06]|uniref:Aromatic peroxygenase n=1 Tax=Pyrenophora seminiperda CCB06 TaxID=1302712 RepID=A0A3M7LVJ5_9PLEO|nr:aromatic peroxygenase [Pyrenophora seminiperda CCB06]
MRSTVLLAALAAPAALAFPWLRPEGIEALLNHPEARVEIARRLNNRNTAQREPRQLLPGLVPGLVDLFGGTLKATLDPILGLLPTKDSVNGLKRFPEGQQCTQPPDSKLANYPFQAPGPTDQRGPCPGLNTLANHGYIPRNGIATIGQIQVGTQELFNMGADLSALLAVGGVLDGGDILSTKMSIGGPDARVGLLNGALNSLLGTPSGIAGHGKFNEGDASATRLDFYLEGDNISFQPELFKQMHQQALEKGDGTYSVDAIKEHFKNRYAASRAANSQFYFNLPSAAVVMGAYYFIPGFFSNGTIGAGGIANEASVTSFYGAKPKQAGPEAWADPNTEYTHVPERIPEQGWYRRATPMTIVEAAAGILDVYLYALPALGGSGADQSFVLGPVDLPNNPQALGCFLYNAVYANFPSELFNTVALVETVVNFLSSSLAPGYKALGCKINFPDASGLTPKSYDEWAKTYVGEAKTKAVGSGWYKKA